QTVALLTTFTFAFATGSWAIASQDLRQHTISNLLVVSIILVLMKIERSQFNQNFLLLLAGFLAGLLPGVRVTSAIFLVAAAVYVVYFYRRKAIYFLFGLSSLLLNIGWNLYFFGIDNALVGGYVKHLEERPSSYTFDIQHILWSAAGILFSPSEGFFFFSPVLLFSLLGFYQLLKRRSGRDEKLLFCFAFASFGLYLHYCIYLFWIGGIDSFGSRVMTDTLPAACFLIGYFLDDLLQKIDRRKFTRIVFTVFLASLFISTGIEAIGAFTQTGWGQSPLPLFVNKNRIWNLSDSQIDRHFRNLIAKIIEPIKDRDEYLQDLRGEIEQVAIADRDGEQALGDRFTVRSKERKIIKVMLSNTGKSQWYGYQTGLESQGETKLKVSFTDSKGETIAMRTGDVLYISGSPKFSEQTEAIGSILFPNEPGNYQMKLTLFADGISRLQTAQANYVHDLTVLPRSK
ncbi:MAG: hypothetical protein F6K28_45125, partial [Microcoleus sp. SIO2G3]|nr:hypothetical protein [Microcoleus sp. SIO2G3]